MQAVKPDDGNEPAKILKNNNYPFIDTQSVDID